MKFALTAFAAVVSVPASADQLLDAALANGGAYSGSDWAYYSTTKVWAGGSTVVGDLIDRTTSGARDRPDLRNTRVIYYDPSKPEALRTKLIRDSGEKGPEVRVKADREGRKDRKIEDYPNYSEIRGLIEGQATKTGETTRTATYRFQVDPAKVRKFGSADIQIDGETQLPKFAGTLTVQKAGVGSPYVSSVIVALPTGKKGRGNAAGKVRLMSMGLRFAPDPVKGVKLLQALGLDTSLQGLGLVTVDLSVLNRIEGYRYVGK